MVHEALGHGLTACSWVSHDADFNGSPGSVSDGYLVPASGSIANLIFGGLSLWLFHAPADSAPPYFLWLFACSTCSMGRYLLFSGLSNFGDWSA